MHKTLKIIAGLVILGAGAAVAWQSYNTYSTCNTLGGQISTFLNSIIGGGAAQACYNAQILTIAGVIVAIVGLAVLFLAFRSKDK